MSSVYIVKLSRDYEASEIKGVYSSHHLAEGKLQSILWKVDYTTIQKFNTPSRTYYRWGDLFELEIIEYKVDK
jgi:hypothetical protein